MSGGWELNVQGIEAKLVQPTQPELTSTPNFVVEVTKDDPKQALVLDCHYSEDELVCVVAVLDQVGHGDEEESDIFSIWEVNFQPTARPSSMITEWISWLTEGADNTFAYELVGLSRALEHQEYIRFLEDLKVFVKPN